MMKFIFSIGLYLCTFSVFANVQSIDIVTSDHPPLITKEKFEDIGYGLYLDILKAVADKAGYKINFGHRPFKRMLHDFAKNKFKLIATSRRTLKGIDLDEKKLEIVRLGDFYNHYFYFKSILKKEVKYTKPSDLIGYKVCLERGSYAIKVLRDAGVFVEESNTNEACLKKLIIQRNDIWGVVSLTANYYTKKLFPEWLKDLEHTQITPTSKDQMVLAGFKGDKSVKEIISRFKKTYEILKKDGTLLKIARKYWGDQVPDIF